MISLSLIGIGTGNPDHLTMQARRAMNGADLILLPRKGEAKADLLDLRRGICAQVLERPVRVVEFDLPVRSANGDYLGAVNDWHDAIARTWSREIARNLPQGGHLALLVWGDPSLYDSTLRIAARLQDDGLDLGIEVVPGITSVQALTAAHAIALSRLAEPFVVTTGRQLRDRGWPQGTNVVVVMLDGGCAFETLEPEGIEIWWGAYLGMEHEALIHGPLPEVANRIVEARKALRERHGWIMDTYLMHRTFNDQTGAGGES